MSNQPKENCSVVMKGFNGFFNKNVSFIMDALKDFYDKNKNQVFDVRGFQELHGAEICRGWLSRRICYSA